MSKYLRFVNGDRADLKQLKPKWEVVHETLRTCPRCKRELPLKSFFHHSFKNMARANPGATASYICNRCRHRRRGQDLARIR